MVVGAGMQGTACAYDLCLHGGVDALVLADYDAPRAHASAARVNRLLGREVCTSRQLDATNIDEVASALAGFSLAISAVPYTMHEPVERAGVQAGCHVVDMGQDTDAFLELGDLDVQAQEEGVCVVADCGLAPGLVNSLAAALLDEMPDATSVRLFCGGLPADPKPPLNYSLVFSMEGLLGEYEDDAIALKDGQVVRLQPLTELQEVTIPGFGTLEAFVTSGGSSTGPIALQGKLESYEYKTMRYPGHCAAMKLFRDCGLWSTSVVPSIGVSPRRMFCHVLESLLTDNEAVDVALARVEVESPSEMRSLNVVDRLDPATGFRAMERLTGFSTSIVAIEVGSGRVSPGVSIGWQAIPGRRLVEGLAERGIVVS